MTGPREIDFGWHAARGGRRSRLTWAEDMGVLFLFHASGESEPLCAGIAESDAREFGELFNRVGGATVEEIQSAAAERWPS